MLPMLNSEVELPTLIPLELRNWTETFFASPLPEFSISILSVAGASPEQLYAGANQTLSIEIENSGSEGERDH